jgi:hypothetical protein
MSQPESSNKQKPAQESTESKKGRRWRLLRIAELIVAVAFIAVLAYIIFYTVKVTKGVSRSENRNGTLVRLQILNGCGISGLASQVSEQLNGYSEAGLEIKVVDTDNFNIRQVKESFVVSRIEDRTAAQRLAQKLGLDPSKVIFEPLENNVHQVSATLILGDNFGLLKLEGKPKEENR